ncbi:MAG: heavy metal translocating P-type ATPase [Caulobacteraceae bacterium]|nr:heavy metal translocating P-type ATPase [Caulobacteraceae bacterium]
MALSETWDAAPVEASAAQDRVELLVGGARCAGCIQKIESAVRARAGVTSARLNLTTGKLSVVRRRGGPDTSELIALLVAMGYRAALFDPGEALAEDNREGRRLAKALGVAAFGAMNVMMFTVPVWAGADMGVGVRTFLYWAAAIVATPCALYAGMPFFESAWRSLRRGRANMDVPITIGVLLTLAVSFSETLLRGREAYFDAAVSLLFLLLVGRYLDHQLRARARSAARSVLALQAPTASVLDEAGAVRRIPTGQVRAGDLLAVAAGERVPVDGVVEQGASELDLSLVTGETLPARAAVGRAVPAGASNLTGQLMIRASAPAENSTLAAIARLMEAGAQSRSRYVQLAEKAAAVYVPVVHAAALLTAIGWLVAGEDIRTAILRAAAVLIITCPCALGLAVPAVQIVACGRLFRRGVLVKSGAALERLAEATHVVFDKTGVLTAGKPVLVGGSADLAALAAPLARASRHPLARALAEAAGEGPLAEEVTETAGFGVEGMIGGRRARLGRADWVGAPTGGGETELWFGFEGETKIRFRFVDEVRPEAAAVVAALKARGLTVEVLSGDAAGPVRACADQLGLDAWRSGMTPMDKAAALDALAAAGRRVLMVGDGLNDAGALAKAHASMAPGSAAEASQIASDLVFEHGLDAVPEALEVARQARARALENFTLSAAYNLVAAPVAILGLASPFVAAIAMSASSLVVTLNALRLQFSRIA